MNSALTAFLTRARNAGLIGGHTIIRPPRPVTPPARAQLTPAVRASLAAQAIASQLGSNDVAPTSGITEGDFKSPATIAAAVGAPRGAHVPYSLIGAGYEQNALDAFHQWLAATYGTPPRAPSARVFGAQ